MNLHEMVLSLEHGSEISIRRNDEEVVICCVERNGPQKKTCEFRFRLIDLQKFGIVQVLDLHLRAPTRGPQMSTRKLLERAADWIAVSLPAGVKNERTLRGEKLRDDLRAKLRMIDEGKDYTSAEAALLTALEVALNEVQELNLALIDSNTELESCHKLIKDAQVSLESWQRAYYAVVNRIQPPTLN